MNLIDILNQILSTKNELRGIVDEKSTDFSRLPVTIYNYLISFYNEGYNNGYRDKFLEETDSGSWSKDPLTPREYEVDTTNYDPYTLDGLVDIMESVLGYRLDIKDVIDTLSDDFTTYPDRLRFLIDTMTNTGYDEGRNNAASVLSVSETIETPTFVWDSITNTFTITTTDTSLEIWYKLGESGVVVRYTNPVQLSTTTRVYYYASAGASHSSYDTYYDCNVTLSDGVEYLPSPSVIQNGNSFSIVSNVENGTIYYNLDNSSWKIYKYPITFTRSGLIVQSYVSDGSKTSKVVSTNLIYYSEEVLNKCRSVSLSQSSNNQITLSTATGNASIYYRINDGQYQLYTSPFIIVSPCIIYAYASKDGYEDSDILYWSCTISSAPTVVKKPLIYQNEYILVIHSYNAGADIQYKYNYNDPWTSLGSNYTSANLYPETNTKVWARVVLDGVSSEEAVYDFYYYKDGFIIPAPVLSFINNRVVITNDGYTTYYTTDGRDPRKYGNVYQGMVNGFTGIPISGTTLIRAISSGLDEQYHIYYSSEVSDSFTPLEEGDEGYVISDEYCFVEGATEIHLSDTISGIPYNLSYSYDKIEWTRFKKDVTGLDGSKRIYLKDASGTTSRRSFGSISFASGDRVSIGGNILSLIYAGGQNWFQVTETSNPNTFERLFKNCTSLVDASKLVIPITTMNEYDFREMFYGCTNLEAAPKELYFTDIKREGCASMFENCSKLITTPKFNIRTIANKGCKRMFANCTKINSVSKFNISDIETSGLEEAFLSCHGLRKVDMIINAVETDSYKNCFRNCRSLSARTYLNDSYYIDSISIRTSNLANSCYSGMFAECYALEEFGDLPGINATANCYYEMFLNDSSLRKFGTIALTSTAPSCLYSTFEGTGLEKAPDLLPANLSGSNCYARLFYNASSLNYIKALFLTDPSSAQYTQNWVVGVAREGTFVQDADATWSEVSVNAIPIGWKINKESNDVGVITNIRCTDGQVSIWADRESEILYQINSSDGEWTLYTGPFNISVDSVIYARCRNNRGELGRIYQSELFKITASTSLIITYSNNVINIEAPSGVVYNYIYYRLANYQSSNFGGDWLTYTTPIPISRSVSIQAYGIGDGNIRSDIEYLDVLFGVDSPRISCVNNIITLTCSTNNYDRIEYRFNTTDDWSIYTGPITISTDKTIYARCSMMDSNNVRIYSEEVSCRCFYDAGEDDIVLYTPVFKKYTTENKAYLQYNGFMYTTWSPSENDGVKISFRISYDSGSSWSNWSDFTGLISYSGDCIIEAYSYKDSKVSDTGSYTLNYSGGGVIVPSAPRIVFNDQNNTVAIYGRSDCNIFYSLDGVSYSGYINYFTINSTVTVYAYQEQIDYGLRSPIASVQCTYTPPATNIDPVISYDSNSGICTISGVGEIHYIVNWEKNNGERIYTEPLKYMNNNMSITAWAIYNGNRSNNVTTNCLWTGGSQTPNPPTIITGRDVDLNTSILKIYNEYSNVEVMYAIPWYTWLSDNSYSSASFLDSSVPSPCTGIAGSSPAIVFAYSKAGNMNSEVITSIYLSRTMLESGYTLISSSPTLYLNGRELSFGNVPSGATLYYSFNNVDWYTYSGSGTVHVSSNKTYIYAYYIYGNNISQPAYITYDSTQNSVPEFYKTWSDEEQDYLINVEGDGVRTIYYSVKNSSIPIINIYSSPFHYNPNTDEAFFVWYQDSSLCTGEITGTVGTKILCVDTPVINIGPYDEEHDAMLITMTCRDSSHTSIYYGDTYGSGRGYTGPFYEYISSSTELYAWAEYDLNGNNLSSIFYVDKNNNKFWWR